MPEGYKRLLSAHGIDLYRKNNLFVQVVSLDRASIRLIHGGITQRKSNDGVWAGISSRFRFRLLALYWRYMRQYPGAFSVINGAFWRVGQNPAELALPLKIDNEVLTEGFMYSAIPQRVNMLEIWNGHAEINELTRDSFYGSTAPDIIGGRNFNANLRKMSFTGRTMIGVSIGGEKAYIFSSKSARQNEGYKVLHLFGANKVIQLDSGGSSQMIANGIMLVHSSRAIPQVIAIFSKK